MPTGYTVKIKDDVSFAEFALNCARAFGACISLRDEPGGGERIPESFAPSSYHIDAADKAKTRLMQLKDLSEEECEIKALEVYKQAEDRRLENLRENNDLLKKYLMMLERINAWEAPTPDHIKLKEFMIEQVRTSIKHDCSNGYYEKRTERKSGNEWLASEIDVERKSLAYHSAEHEKEVSRAASRTKWIAELRDSLIGKD